MSLSYIGQQCIIYCGSVFLIGGLIGNTINILIFSKVRKYRQTPCTFYFLVASIANLIYISFNFTTRIYGNIIGYDLSNLSITWCKTRQFLIVAFSMITLTNSCLAAIDQFLATSKHVRFRRLSNMKWTYRLVTFVILLWFLHAIPCLIFYNVPSSTKKCAITHPIYAVYNRIYLLGLICLMPIIVTTIFGCLTYYNIRTTRGLAGQHVDRQLVRMTLLQVFLIVLSLAPYGLLSIYSLITENFVKDSNRLAQESFVLTIFTLMTYSYYSGNCYMFWFSSSQFRRRVKRAILLWRTNHQIVPSDIRGSKIVTR
ncbi:unnamed protein product [Adineta ricciae]|uniref:G-protein coupled receptors family 1 profile domain-containing protein n=1 Tax=Adineta ricciae TaxID=249248 RepID=A0A816F9A7_ADIRI|nr:unnamed protein product [Adineta ricciae]CAF1656796.1 unnamed protein product [Adineta ricciae]